MGEQIFYKVYCTTAHGLLDVKDGNFWKPEDANALAAKLTKEAKAKLDEKCTCIVVKERVL